jgi:type IV secretory pathway VirB10-like protein
LSPSRATENSSKKRTRTLVVAWGALAVALLALGLLSRPDKTPEPTRAETTEEAPADEPARQAAPAPTPPVPTASVTQTAAAPASSAEVFPPSHPINEERLRMQRQNQFVQMMNDAMDLEDGPRLRELAKRFAEEKFSDPDKHGEGYLLVADCLEHPGSASRAAAQAFWDRERGSNLRRYVKRHCLE